MVIEPITKFALRLSHKENTRRPFNVYKNKLNIRSLLARSVNISITAYPNQSAKSIRYSPLSQENIVGRYEEKEKEQNIGCKLDNNPKKFEDGDLGFFEWQHRRLPSTYLIIWIDTISLKIGAPAKDRNSIYIVIVGLSKSGVKEVLDIWPMRTQTQSYWVQALNGLKLRGVQNIPIFCFFKMLKLKEAINIEFPKASLHISISHLINNACKKSPKESRCVLRGALCEIYSVNSKKEALDLLDVWISRLGSKYIFNKGVWQNIRKEVTIYFNYPHDIRKIIYTKGSIDNLTRAIRNYNRMGQPFIDDQAAKFAICNSIEKIKRRRTLPIQNWDSKYTQFANVFKRKFKL